MIDFWNYKKSNFSGGGLHAPLMVASRNNTYVPAKNFVAPKRIDSRDMCIQTSDQGSTPHCAGFSCAGFIEVQNWRRLHYPEQIDGSRIYTEAKKLDGLNYDGTTLDCAANAAINLGLIQGKPKLVANDFNSIKFAIHLNLVCMAGFGITDEWNKINKKTGEISNFGNNATKLGGHAVLICGYDETGVYIQNSWGQSWGIYGFAIIPWQLVSKQFMYGLVIV